MRLWSAKPERFNGPVDCDLEATKGITEQDVRTRFTPLHGQRQNWPPEITKLPVDSVFDEDGNFTAAERTRPTRRFR